MNEYELFLQKLEQLEAMELEAAPIIQAIADLKKEIKKTAIEQGASVTHGGVTVSYRKGYTRTGYDKKRLDLLAETLPEVANAKTETEIDETASVRVKFA